MKPLKHTMLYMQGTKKRIGDIKSIFQNLEYSLSLLHTSLISTNNCVTILYSWGHIIIYTYPQDQIITVEIMYPTWEAKVGQVLDSMIKIFQPKTHTKKEIA